MEVVLFQTEIPEVGRARPCLDYFFSLWKEYRRRNSDPVDLVCLPEMFLGGFAWRKLPELSREIFQEGLFDKLREFCRREKTALSLTCPEELSAGGDFANTHFFLTPDGEVAGRYRKIHLIGIGGFREPEFFQAGFEPVVVDYKNWKIGLAICYDLRFPELFRSYFQRDCELVLLPSQWPARRALHWEILTRARAVENQCYVAATNIVGRPASKMEFPGDSQLVDFNGGVILRGSSDQVEVLSARLDRSALWDYRNSFPVSADIRFDLPEAADPPV